MEVRQVSSMMAAPSLRMCSRCGGVAGSRRLFHMRNGNRCCHSSRLAKLVVAMVVVAMATIVVCSAAVVVCSAAVVVLSAAVVVPTSAAVAMAVDGVTVDGCCLLLFICLRDGILCRCL